MRTTPNRKAFLMSVSFNQVTIAVHLTADPVSRAAGSATVVTFSGATNRRFTTTNPNTGAKERKEETSFVDFEAWGKTGEVCMEYLKKGAPVLISGRLKQDTWVDKATNTNRSKLKVVVESVQFLGGAGGTNNRVEDSEPQDVPDTRPVPAARTAARPRPQSPVLEHPSSILDDEPPF